MDQPLLMPDSVVAEVLSCWPQTVSVFFRHHMICVGCAMSRFETLAEVAAIYSLDLNTLLRELRQAVEAVPVAHAA